LGTPKKTKGENERPGRPSRLGYRRNSEGESKYRSLRVTQVKEGDLRLGALQLIKAAGSIGQIRGKAEEEACSENNLMLGKKKKKK